MARPWFLVVVTGLFGGLFAPAVFAQTDGGVIDPVVPTSCGALDDEGLCFGDVAAWCSEPNDDGTSTAPTERFNCSAIVVDGVAVDARCVDTLGFGAWCGTDPGEPCLVPSSDGPRQLVCLAGAVPAPDGACDLRGGCTTGVAPCNDDTRLCSGTFLRTACGPFGQPLGVDCTALDATCSVDACVDVPRDGPCDDQRLRCADGLVCTGRSATAGVCLPPMEIAERVIAEAPPAPEPATGCAAARVPATSGRLPFAGLCALALVIGLSRSRRSPSR